MSKGKLYLGKVEVSKIDKNRLFKSEKTGRVYMDVSIWINDEPDNYGNHLSIQQSTKKDEDKIFIGNAKAYEVPQSATTEAEVVSEEPQDDLPF
mgnify:CR=1 FL=1